MNIRIFEFLSKSTGNYISIWSQKQGYIFNGMDNEVPKHIQKWEIVSWTVTSEGICLNIV